MKLLRTLAVVTAVTIIALFNWMCKDDNIVMSPDTNEQQKDGGDASYSLNIDVYQNGDPTGDCPQHYSALISSFSANFTGSGYQTSGKYGDLGYIFHPYTQCPDYQTTEFLVAVSGSWNNAPTNWVLRWLIKKYGALGYILDEFHQIQGSGSYSTSFTISPSTWDFSYNFHQSILGVDYFPK